MTERRISSTYRLQLSPGFGFEQARDLVGYFARLGVTHLYLSPVLQARPGSTHGYDVVDPSTVSRDLGGEEEFRALADTAHRAGLGLLVDVVPNHLGIGPQNRDWQLLLAEGQSGEGGRVFDVDWQSPLPGASGKVILPVLADQYGVVLVNGDLRVAEEPDADGRRFCIRYHDHAFPLSPESLEALERVGRLDTLTGTPGQPETWNRLHALLERQHYRLVYWRIGDRVINYRRFFAINDLAGVRVEDKHVFERTHAKILELVADGAIDGLRIDHPDGMADPAQYLERLERRTGGAWTVVEKILHPGEPLQRWAAAGTTGYEFCNDVLGLFVNPHAEARFDELDVALGGDPRPFDEQVAAAKREVLDNDLAAEFARLVRRLWALAQQHLDVRDIDDRQCAGALADALVALPVYRTYVDPQTGHAAPRDLAIIDAAVNAACGGASAPFHVLNFTAAALNGTAGSSPLHLEVVTRFQQLSGALMAKGVEDTVLYRYLRMVALNEVGGDPTRFGISSAEFHRLNSDRAAHHPDGMLTTATHDTKRGEDVRLRIAALTEMPERWRSLVSTATEDADIDRPTASLLVQTMIGVWPLLDSGEVTPDLRRRLTHYGRKAAREAGVHTNWYDPAEAYEAALDRFVDRVLDDGPMRKELTTVAAAAAEIGMVSSLSQVVLRTLSPGVPDLYWGNELWDDSLVDPDNRRPVEWQRRQQLVAAVGDTGLEELWRSRRDGRVKLRVLTTALKVRNNHPGAFGSDGGYEPLETAGEWADHVVAFARTSHGAAQVVVVAPCRPGAIMGPDLLEPIGACWRDTSVALPDGTWSDAFAGARGEGRVSRLFGRLPVAILTRRT
ncbi:MAG: malto-oligosyltrehalose synthase [Nitriliruptorales bacterium]|nr:malto-oligosyltrehalose synthase [Nitriliruptorales bacterium]